MANTTTHRINCWKRHAGKLPRTAADLDAFRASAKLSPRTVESVIDAVRLHLKRQGRIVPLGTRLKRPAPRPIVPTADELCRFYRVCGRAHWPAGKGRLYPRASWLGEATVAQWWRAYIVLASWTGLRTSDLRRLTWADWDAGELQATKKVGAPVPLVQTDHVERHLKPLRGLSDTILIKAPSSQLNREFRRVSTMAGIRPLTTQMLRRFAVTEWSIASDAAGAILHGCGVRQYYLSRRTVMERAAKDVRVPEAFLTPSERSATSRAKRALIDALRRASPREREWLVQAAMKVG